MTDPRELTVIEKPLSQREEKRLDELEAVIDKNIKAFFAVWFALKEINELRLYRTAENRTFAQYCDEEWDLSKSRAYEFIDAAEVIENVRNCGHSGELEMSAMADIWSFTQNNNSAPPFPSNERQARNLKIIPPEHQKEVWERVCLKAELTETRITAKFVSQCVKEFKLEKFGEVVEEVQRSAAPPHEPRNNSPRISLPMRTSFAALLGIIQHEKDRGFRDTNQDVVITWLRTLLSAAEEAR